MRGTLPTAVLGPSVTRPSTFIWSEHHGHFDEHAVHSVPYHRRTAPEGGPLGSPTRSVIAGPGPTRSTRAGLIRGRVTRPERRAANAAARSVAGWTSIRSTNPASAADSSGTTTRATPRRASAATIDRIPGTRRSSSPSDSSPISARAPFALACSDPSRIATAIAALSDAPVLRRSAGARLTGDSSRREDQTAVPDRTAVALPGLLERGVSQADDREAGQPRGDIHLDPDHPAVDQVQGCGEDRGQHQRRLGRPSQPAVTPDSSVAQRSLCPINAATPRRFWRLEPGAGSPKLAQDASPHASGRPGNGPAHCGPNHRTSCRRPPDGAHPASSQG